MTTTTKKLIPADIWDALKASAEQHGGIGAGWFTDDPAIRAKSLLSRAERDARDASICHAYQTGLSYKQITKAMQVTTGMICRALRKGGVLARPTRYKPRKPLPYAERPPKSRYLDGHRGDNECQLYVKAMCSGEVKPEVDTNYRLCAKHRQILANIAKPARRRRAA